MTEELESALGSLRRSAAVAWAEWIRALGPWYQFITLNHSKVLHPEAFLKKETLLMNLVSEHIWGKNFRRRGRGLSYISALERQSRWAPHSHMLVDQAWLPYDFIHKTWQDFGGFAWVVPVGDIGGVAGYVSKYVAKDGDIEVRLHRPLSTGQLGLPALKVDTSISYQTLAVEARTAGMKSSSELVLHIDRSLVGREFLALNPR